MVINKGMVGTVDLRRLSDSADSEKKKTHSKVCIMAKGLV